MFLMQNTILTMKGNTEMMQNTILTMKGNTEMYIILIAKEKTRKSFSNKKYAMEEKLVVPNIPLHIALIFLYQSTLIH